MKKYRNPLGKRIIRELIGDRAKYLVISLFMILIIGFVSGMYVANGSMMRTFSESKAKFTREDGHFELDKKADSSLISAIESGKMADVKSYYLKKAYDKVDKTVYKEAEKQLYEETEKTLKEAVKLQITSEVSRQAAAAGLNKTQTEALIETTLKEKLDSTVEENLDEALKKAKESDEYKKALDDAIKTAHEKAEEEVNKKYKDIEKRYSLDEDIDEVPVTLFEDIYKNTTERKENDKVSDTNIRVFSLEVSKRINKPDILSGRLPESDDEIAIDRMHADNRDIKLGDILYIGNMKLKVCGLISKPNYTTLYENNTDSMFDAITFDIGIVKESTLERINEKEVYCYDWLYKDAAADDAQQKIKSDNFLKTLLTNAVVNEKELKDYVPEYLNQGIQFAYNDFGNDLTMGKYILAILVMVLAFIFAITVSNTIAHEASAIGTLLASGYTRAELLRHYMSMPILVTLLSAIIGNGLGYTVFKNVVVGMYYNSYSLPTYYTVFSLEALLSTTLIPVVLMLIINLGVIYKKLRLSPLSFLRHDLSGKKASKRSHRLPDIRFLDRFRLRIFGQNISNYIVIFLGVFFVTLMLALAVGFPNTLSYYRDNAESMMISEYQYMVKDYLDKDGNTIETKTEGAEKFAVKSLLRKGDRHNENITIYGILPDSNYIKGLPSLGNNEVSVSESLALKFNISVGDTITLSEKYESFDYKFKVADIYKGNSGIAVFMSKKAFDTAFDLDEESFSGWFSDKKISDVDEDSIATVISSEQVLKLVHQLNHSMGDYMTYFQYLCVILSAALIFLLTKIIIEKNEKSISMIKILGFKNSEISRLYIVTTFWVVLISAVISAFLGSWLISHVWSSYMMSIDGYFEFYIGAWGIAKMIIFIMLSYVIVTALDFIRIKKIPMDTALKSEE